MSQTQFSQKALTFLEQKTQNKRLGRLKYFIYSIVLAFGGAILAGALGFVSLYLSSVILAIIIQIIISIAIGIGSLYLITFRCNDAGMNPLIYFYIRAISLLVGVIVAILSTLGITEISMIVGWISSIINIINLIVALIILFTPSHEFTFFTMWKGMSNSPVTVEAPKPVV